MGLGQGRGLYPGQGGIMARFIEGPGSGDVGSKRVCVGPCWLGPLATRTRIQCLFDAVPLGAGSHNGPWCWCSRQVALPCLCGHAEMNPAHYGSPCGWAPSFPALKGVGCLGVPPGAAPQRDLGGGVGSHGSWTGDTMSSAQGWAFQPPGVAPGVFPPPSSQTTPPDSRQLFSIHFISSSPLPASITKEQ